MDENRDMSVRDCVFALQGTFMSLHDDIDREIPYRAALPAALLYHHLLQGSVEFTHSAFIGGHDWQLGPLDGWLSALGEMPPNMFLAALKLLVKLKIIAVRMAPWRGKDVIHIRLTDEGMSGYSGGFKGAGADLPELPCKVKED